MISGRKKFYIQDSLITLVWCHIQNSGIQLFNSRIKQLSIWCQYYPHIVLRSPQSKTTMKSFAESLMIELHQQLTLYKTDIDNVIRQTELSIKITIETIEKLKTNFHNHTFENKAEEIEFFKTIKPNFSAKLIYYNEIYNIELAKPSGTKKSIKKYYRSQLQKLKLFYKENLEFYRYYRAGNTNLDKKYFIRGKHDIKLTLDSSYFQSDYSFSTSHDFKVAQIKANEAIRTYLENQLKKPKQRKVPDDILKWTGSKVALVELLYALHAENIFNNGNANLKDIANCFETIFHIELKQFNRIYLEIRNRKTIEKTHFLNTLKEKLLIRIENSDK